MKVTAKEIYDNTYNFYISKGFKHVHAEEIAEMSVLNAFEDGVLDTQEDAENNLCLNELHKIRIREVEGNKLETGKEL